MISLQNIRWHQTIGRLIEQLDEQNFWTKLIRQLKHVITFDSWVILVFSDKTPIVLAESPTADGKEDQLFKDYIRGFYLIDPFYIDNREKRKTGLFLLDDVAPEYFEQTDYYQHYFRLNIVADELHLNYQIDSENTLCLSLGNQDRFKADHITTIQLIQPWLLGLMKQRFNIEKKLVIAEPKPLPTNTTSLNDIQHLLTNREFEVSCLLLSGYSTKEISRKLDITIETIKVHRKHIYTKLGIHSQAELFSRFLQSNSNRD